MRWAGGRSHRLAWISLTLSWARGEPLHRAVTQMGRSIRAKGCSVGHVEKTFEGKGVKQRVARLVKRWV